MSECLFCRIAAHEIPVKALFEDSGVLAFPDIEPKSPKHVLVIPKEHFGSVVEAPAEVLGRLMAVAAEVGGREMPGGFRLVVNTGADGGQSVGHLHVHVLGGRQMGWPPG